MAEIIRLNKVLRELNISLDRAVDFLETKNVEIEKRPTTKITSEVYDLLAGEFQTDANKKVASKEVGEAKLKEKEALRVQREQEIELKLQKAEAAKTVFKAKQVLQGPKKVGKIDLDGSKKAAEKQPEAVKPAVAPKEVVPKVEVAAPKAAPTPKEAAAPKVEVATPKAAPTPKVVPAPKEAATPKVESTPKVKPATKTAPAPLPVADKKETPVVSTTTETTPPATPVAPAATANEEPIASGEQKVETTNYQKLSGPKSTGQKIDLTQFNKPKKAKPVTPAAGANSADAQKKTS